MAPQAIFEPESEHFMDEFNIYKDDDNEENDNEEDEKSGFFKDINWNHNILELFEEIKEIKQDIWIQILTVYLDKNDNVSGIEFKITPEGIFYHEYIFVNFDEKGKITNDLKENIETYKEQDKEDDFYLDFKVVKKFYQTLVNLQNKQKIIIKQD
ncbi:hypothetical protein M1771_03295 [Spiroplasma citri]|uniref:Uncharacterized protein n=1 Tax=Spiroplasma citri TaxID=2133 RepID=A0AAX3T0A5_SPICI|nr:hypothetical protein [Spiroplasma citri]WFG97044.1 hypothetical protein M0C40_03310 [Spiroplasma citri]WFH00941.1 hypothetical protein M1771_03295 [Spiroplasma citri]